MDQDCKCENEIVVVYQGEDKTLTVQLVQSSYPTLPYKLGTPDELIVYFPTLVNNVSGFLQKKLSLSGVVITNADNGTLDVILTAADTAQLEPSQALGIKVQLNYAGKLTNIKIAEALSVSAF